MSTTARAEAAILEWFDEPSPADPGRLADRMALIFEPEVITVRDHLDLLPLHAVVRDDAGLVLEVVASDASGNLWYQTGDPDALVTAAIALPAVLIHSGEATA